MVPQLLLQAAELCSKSDLVRPGCAARLRPVPHHCTVIRFPPSLNLFHPSGALQTKESLALPIHCPPNRTEQSLAFLAGTYLANLQGTQAPPTPPFLPPSLPHPKQPKPAPPKNPTRVSARAVCLCFHPPKISPRQNRRASAFNSRIRHPPPPNFFFDARECHGRLWRHERSRA